jgi:hypothetical protein
MDIKGGVILLAFQSNGICIEYNRVNLCKISPLGTEIRNGKAKFACLTISLLILYKSRFKSYLTLFIEATLFLLFGLPVLYLAI